MVGVPHPLRALFIASGWQGQAYSIAGEGKQSAVERCLELIEQFKGLRVGETGPGSETPASDVHFYVAPRPEVQVVTQPWRKQVGRVAAFAAAHNDHMILFVNDVGEYFVFTDPDDSLHRAGTDFGQLMQVLLWGYTLGAPLRRDA